MKSLKEQLLDAKYVVNRLRNERAKARSEFAEASKKLELANEFKDSVINVKDSLNPVQQHLDCILKADNKLKSTEKGLEEAIDNLERIEQAIKKQEELNSRTAKTEKTHQTDNKVVSKIDDNSFWNTKLF